MGVIVASMVGNATGSRSRRPAPISRGQALSKAEHRRVGPVLNQAFLGVRRAGTPSRRDIWAADEIPKVCSAVAAYLSET